MSKINWLPAKEMVLGNVGSNQLKGLKGKHKASLRRRNIKTLKSEDSNNILSHTGRLSVMFGSLCDARTEEARRGKLRHTVPSFLIPGEVLSKRLKVDGEDEELQSRAATFARHWKPVFHMLLFCVSVLTWGQSWTLSPSRSEVEV